MTRSDIEHLAQVTHSMRSLVDDQNFDLLIDRMLWAIHASRSPRFDVNRFASACKGDGFQIFAKQD